MVIVPRMSKKVTLGETIYFIFLKERAWTTLQKWTHQQLEKAATCLVSMVHVKKPVKRGGGREVGRQWNGKLPFFVYPGSEFFHSGSRIHGQKDFWPRIRIRIKEFKFLTQKIVSKLSEVGIMIRDFHPGSGSRVFLSVFLCVFGRASWRGGGADKP